MLAKDDAVTGNWSEIHGRELQPPLSDKSLEQIRACIRPQNSVTGVNWYAVRYLGNVDSEFVECLRRVEIEVFMPTCLELRAVPKRQLTAKERLNPVQRKKPTAVPLFPGYPFVKCDLRDERRHQVFVHLNIQGVLCDGESASIVPALMPDYVINALKARAIGGALPMGTTVKQLAFTIGEQVRISTGIFAGNNAVVDALPDVPIERLDEFARIKLLLNLFGRATVVELSIADIEKL